MSYYELNYTEPALSMIDSYKHFVNDNKNISDVFRESHLRFINSLQSLILSKEKNQTDKLSLLKEKLTPFKAERRISWIIDKIDELK